MSDLTPSDTLGASDVGAPTTPHPWGVGFGSDTLRASEGVGSDALQHPGGIGYQSSDASNDEEFELTIHNNQQKLGISFDNQTFAIVDIREDGMAGIFNKENPDQQILTEILTTTGQKPDRNPDQILTTGDQNPDQNSDHD